MNRIKEILNFTYDIFRADWNDFVKRAKKHPNIVYTRNLKDEVGDYEMLHLKKEKVIVAKFYIDEMEIVTDVMKRNFFMYLRGMDVDIWNGIMESHTERLKHVVLIENDLGTHIPHVVKNTLTEAKNVVSEMNFDEKKVLLMPYNHCLEYYNENINKSPLGLQLKEILMEKFKENK